MGYTTQGGSVGLVSRTVRGRLCDEVLSGFVVGNAEMRRDQVENLSGRGQLFFSRFFRYVHAASFKVSFNEDR